MSEQPDSQAGNERSTVWTPVSETVLQAYVDGLLDQDQRDQVKAFLAIHPEEAERVAGYLRLNESLHDHYDGVLVEAVPERFSGLLDNASASREDRVDRSPVRLSSSWWLSLWRAVVSPPGSRGSSGVLTPAMSFGRWHVPSYVTTMVWLGLGVAMGLGWKMKPDSPSDMLPPMVKQAAVAYVTYASEEAHPVNISGSNETNVCSSCHAMSPKGNSVEISASNRAFLVNWLSKRLGMNLKVAELNALGYSLMGGRLLPGVNGPVAQFLYRDKSGHRLTLFIKAKESKGDQSPAFYYSREEGVNAYYWIESGTGYVLTGNLEKSALSEAAAAVDRQLNMAPPLSDGLPPVSGMRLIGKGA